MADEKLNTGPAENISPEAAEPITTPEQAAASEPRQEQTGPAIPESGDVVVSFDKINELMAEKRQNARAEVEKSETPETPEAAAPGETPQPANTEEPKKPRRGRPPKAEKAATENQKSEKSAGARKGRPPKADKTAPDKPKPSKRDKVSRSDGKAPDAKEPIKPAQDTAPKETAAVEQTAPEPTTPPRPVEEGKLVYLKLSEVHPFHTFRPHPFKVRDDAKMQEIVASIRVNGVMVPGLARPEKDGNGYEIVAGHRRTHGSELAGLEEMPFIVREMTDHEAVQAMKDSNKQRDGMLPSELAALLELEVEDIKHQGGRLKGVAEPYSHVLRKIRECARAALMDGEAVADRLTNTCEAEQREQREAMERSLTRDEERIEVLDKMVMRLYEDMIAGRISEQNFNTMLEKTQTEQAELKAKVSEGRKRLSDEAQLANDAKQWVEAIQEYANITELDAATLNRLIKEIVVHERID